MSFRKACHLGVLSAKEAKIMIPHSVLSYTDPKVSIYAIFYGKNPRMSMCSLWEDIFSNHPKSQNVIFNITADVLNPAQLFDH